MADVLPITPIWKYASEDMSEGKETDTIHLLIWSGGCSVVAFNQSGIPLEVQTYLTRKRPEVSWIKELVRQNTILKHQAKKVKRIWVSEERNLLIPDDIYDKNYVESWVRKFHYLSPEDLLLHFKLTDVIGASISFPVPEDLKAFLTDTFLKADFAPLSRMAFLRDEEQNPADIQIISFPREVILTLSHQGQFLYHLVCPYENPQDVVYKLALILEERGINQEQITNVRFSGMAPFWNNIMEELGAYFPLKSDEDTTEMTLLFLKKLYSCA